MELLDVGLLCHARTERLIYRLSSVESMGLYRAMAILGAAYGVKIGIFGIDDLKTEGNECYGTALVWNNGMFETVKAQLPKYLESMLPINRRFMSMYPQELADALIARMAEKTTPPKDKLPQILIMGKMAEYVIPTLMVRTFDEVRIGIERWKSCVLKPNIGRQGRGVLYADWNEGEIRYESPNAQGVLTQDEWAKYRKALPEYREFLVQPRLNFHDRSGRAIDFRVLVSKGGNGTWEIVDVYVRYGQNRLVSNVAEGGLLGRAKEYLQFEFNDTQQQLYQKICDLGTRVPVAFETALGEAAESFYGIDVGIDADTMLPYVIEVNAFPGTCFHKYHLAEKRIEYYKYLLGK